MVKERFTVNPFPDLNLTPAEQQQLKDLANNLITTNVGHYNDFVASKRVVDKRRWKPVKTREQLQVYSERPEAAHSTGGSFQLSGSGLPMILMVGPKEGTLDDLIYGILSKDLESMRINASYCDQWSGAAVLDPIIEPTLEDPLQSLVVKWVEVDLPLASMSLVKNRDYVFIEGTGFVTDANGERLGYHLMHSVNFAQTHELPNRVRGNIAIIGLWRQTGPNTMEIYATGIFNPCGDMIRMLVVPGMASVFLSSVKYAYCGQMKKLGFMLDKAYTESKQHGAPNMPNVCVTCSSSVSGRRLGDFGQPKNTCKLCFGHVCHGCKVVRKLSFVDSDLSLSQRKVTFCGGCITSVVKMNASDCARMQMLSTNKRVTHFTHSSANTSSTASGDYGSEISYVSS